MEIIVAVVQEPMAALDDMTFVEVFKDYESAEKWVEKKLREYDGPYAPYTREEMNWNIYYRKI